tara:strand:+ start:5878 stop:6054 length:177 start_codon:yes stop_codon:yes gene_type:complete
MNTELNNLREEIQGTLEVEKKNLEAYDPRFYDPDKEICMGWCEALQYVLRQIDHIEGE